MRAESFLAPAGVGAAEIAEKRSRFIARVVPVDSEDEAKAEIDRVKAERRDASHNCWCYIIRGGPERYSDDGEPQGTAGLPMLEVFRRGGICGVCCVVTRYFGGVLLGTGGLSRAYSEAARRALEAAGTAEFRLRERAEIHCPYDALARVKSVVESFGGVMENAEFGERVELRVLLPAGCADELNKRLADASAGAVRAAVTGEAWVAGSA